MKTNKTITDRIRLTKNGKLMTRAPGQDHFNAKESRNRQLAKKRSTKFHMSKADISRFLLS